MNKAMRLAGNPHHTRTSTKAEKRAVRNKRREQFAEQERMADAYIEAQTPMGDIFEPGNEDMLDEWLANGRY